MLLILCSDDYIKPTRLLNVILEVTHSCANWCMYLYDLFMYPIWNHRMALPQTLFRCKDLSQACVLFYKKEIRDFGLFVLKTCYCHATAQKSTLTAHKFNNKCKMEPTKCFKGKQDSLASLIIFFYFIKCLLQNYVLV